MAHKIEELMKDVNGATFIGIDAVTVVKLAGGKSNPYQGRIQKVMVGANVMVFQNKHTNGYENMVMRRLEKEGKEPQSFVLGSRAWGVRRDGAPFVDHDGKLYLEVIFLKAGEVHYIVDGYKPVDKEFLAEHGYVEKEEGKQGGLDNKVIIRTFNVDNIKSLKINQTEHLL